MNKEVLSKYDLLTVGECAGVTIEEAKNMLPIKEQNLEWYSSLNIWI